MGEGDVRLALLRIVGGKRLVDESGGRRGQLAKDLFRQLLDGVLAGIARVKDWDGRPKTSAPTVIVNLSVEEGADG